MAERLQSGQAQQRIEKTRGLPRNRGPGVFVSRRFGLVRLRRSNVFFIGRR
ncbi:MAG: hypothetical protein HYU47_07470 [Deltaproteobacteria bacterium]|nr:hypothetical protein [Deltaproteobacteria bacterium]